MLIERSDLWKPETLAPHLLAQRDKWEGEHPRWKKIKTERVPVFNANESNACQRRLCYAYSGETPAPNDIDGALRMYDGNPHADAMVHWLGILGYIVTDREKPVKKLLRTKTGLIRISGHLDGIVQAPEGDRAVGRIPYILECKGLSTFTTHPKYGKPIEDIVNKSYRAQAQAYMWLTGIPRTLFVIKDKNTSQLRFFQLLANPKVMKWLIQRWVRVTQAVKNDELLDREYARDSLECQWCRHSKLCWGTDP